VEYLTTEDSLVLNQFFRKWTYDTDSKQPSSSYQTNNLKKQNVDRESTLSTCIKAGL
jgi:aminoglycoside N3'-acetyltransferase